MRSTSSAIQFVNNSILICKSSQNMNAKMVFASKKNVGPWRASALHLGKYNLFGVLRIYRSRRSSPRIMASHHRAGRMLWRNTPM
jgi:hypothetical protein